MIGATIFLGAFLLFLVQPIIAKQILPQFGGSAAVWATCLVFFQVALLLGYFYAHQLVQRDRSGRWRRAHVALLAASLLVLPIVPGTAPQALADWPGVQIVALLLATIGLPFVLLATTSPLLQAWLAQHHSARNPYRLFVVSNLASLAALLAYPWLIEPWLGTAAQANAWSLLYAAYVAMASWLAWTMRHSMPVGGRVVPASRAQTLILRPPAKALPPRRVLGWIALAALASYELVAVTNHLTQNIPSVPMMWVLPLVVYLLTFTLCFDGDRWYRPRAFRVATLAAVLMMCWMLWDARVLHNLLLQSIVYIAGLFVIGMFCHGELARERPPARQLTQFYLCVAGGGALGGALVGLAAPALLPGYFEVEIGLLLVTVAVLWRSSSRTRVWAAAGASVALCAGFTTAYRIDDITTDVVAMRRNFYGVVRVREEGGTDEPASRQRVLVHGSILHGQQLLADDLRRLPTSYYVATSGIGRLLRARADQPLQVGVVGLGAGTIAVYGRAGDRYHFFEIDPAVADVAQRYFTYLSDSAADVHVSLGDGRVLLQRLDDPAQRFDVLAIDAFSGDSIPVHLLTREAVALYLQRIAPDGVIALHISNRHLDLRPVVSRIAADLQLQLAYIEDKIDETEGPEKASSDWILLARDGAQLDHALIRDAARALPPTTLRRAWTDDYSNVAQVMSLLRPMGD